MTPRVVSTLPAVRRARFAPLSLPLVLVVLGGAAGCAGRFVPPVGPPIPEPAATTAWDGLSAACRDVTALRAELRVSGEIDGRRFPSLTTGMAVEADRLAVVATYSARPIFNLAGASDEVTLLDHQERRVVTGPAAAIVEALVGVPVDPGRLLALVTGCVSRDPAPVAGARIDRLLRVDLADAVVYLVQADGGWRLRAAAFDDVIVEYRRVEHGWPRELEMRRGGRVRLRLRMVEWERNPILPAALFKLTVPASYIHTPLEAIGDERLIDASSNRVAVVPEG